MSPLLVRLLPIGLVKYQPLLEKIPSLDCEKLADMQLPLQHAH